MHVKGKVCVVTGAASGIGEAVARAYAEAGARGVVVADLKTSRDRLAKVAGDIDGLAVTGDVGLEEDIKALIAAAEDKYGPVDVFFSNAGLSRKGQESASDADWDVSWRVHVMSHVFAARALVPGMLRARIRLSPEHGVRGWPAGITELDALRRHQERGGGARRASRHSIWRPRHPRVRAVPAIGADRHDHARPERGEGRRRAAAAGSGAHGDRGDGGRTLSDPVAPAGRGIHAAQGLQPRPLADRHAAAARQDLRRADVSLIFWARTAAAYRCSSSRPATRKNRAATS